MAEKYFGSEDPMGKVLRLENQFDLIVKGVMADLPTNSHLQFDFVMPFVLLEMGGQRLDQWDLTETMWFICGLVSRRPISTKRSSAVLKMSLVFLV